MLNSRDFHFDDLNKTVEIAGIKYSYSLFEAWGENGLDTESVFQLKRSGSGRAITIIDGQRKWINADKR